MYSPISARIYMRKTARYLSEYPSSPRKLYFSHRSLYLIKRDITIPHAIDIKRRDASLTLAVSTVNKPALQSS